jgi:hypothetical protein
VHFDSKYHPRKQGYFHIDETTYNPIAHVAQADTSEFAQYFAEQHMKYQKLMEIAVRRVPEMMCSAMWNDDEIDPNYITTMKAVAQILPGSNDKSDDFKDNMEKTLNNAWRTHKKQQSKLRKILHTGRKQSNTGGQKQSNCSESDKDDESTNNDEEETVEVYTMMLPQVLNAYNRHDVFDMNKVFLRHICQNRPDLIGSVDEVKGNRQEQQLAQDIIGALKHGMLPEPYILYFQCLDNPDAPDLSQTPLTLESRVLSIFRQYVSQVVKKRNRARDERQKQQEALESYIESQGGYNLHSLERQLYSKKLPFVKQIHKEALKKLKIWTKQTLFKNDLNSKHGIPVAITGPHNNEPKMSIERCVPIRIYYAHCSKEESNRPTYGKGSGSASVGIDPSEFEVRPMPMEMISVLDMVKDLLLAEHNLDENTIQSMNACETKIYLGDDIAGKDTVNQLRFHVDYDYTKQEGTSFNTQKRDTPVVSVSFGASTLLSFKLQYIKDGERKLQDLQGSETNIELRDMDVFMLDHRDEQLEYNANSFVKTRYRHGVTKHSRGIRVVFVFRAVARKEEYDTETNRLILKSTPQSDSQDHTKVVQGQRDQWIQSDEGEKWHSELQKNLEKSREWKV